VTQFTLSKNEYSANRVPQEWVSPHDVADKRRITNITKNNTCVTFESTAKNASANSAYRSIAKENRGSQEALGGAARDDMHATDKVCSDLMGPDSIEDTKTKSGRYLTFIGYDIDLDKRLVTISERNIMRTLYGFLNVELQKPIKVKTMQKLASWASR
jgi:hypothetical protein